MSRNRHIARHRATPESPLKTLSQAVTSHAGSIGRPAAVAVAASGLMLGGVALPANAGTTAPVQQAAAATEVASTQSAAPAAAPAQTASASAAATHTVQSGDTLGSISSNYGVSLEAIFAANGLGWESVIYPGDVIALSGGAGAAPSAPAPQAPAAPAPVAPAPQPEMAPAPADTSTMGITTASSDIQRMSATPAVASSGLGASIVASARAQIGATQDCTILVEVALRSVGKSVGDLAPEQFYGYGDVVSSPQPGDLVIRPGHVGIYVGDGRVISSGMNGINATFEHSLSDLPGSSFVRVR